VHLIDLHVLEFFQRIHVGMLCRPQLAVEHGFGFGPLAGLDQVLHLLGDRREGRALFQRRGQQLLALVRADRRRDLLVGLGD